MTSTERRQHWKQQLADWHASRLSGAAFCKQQSLSYHQFTYWRKRVTETAAPVKQSEAGFARVAPLPAQRSGELVLSLPGGISITGLHRDNVDLLSAILRQL